MRPKLQGFLIDDLKKVEHHVNEIIENIYARGQQETFAKDIEQIDSNRNLLKEHEILSDEQEIEQMMMTSVDDPFYRGGDEDEHSFRMFGKPYKELNADELEEFMEEMIRLRNKFSGPVLPSDEDPINPFQPKPIGPVLPDKMAFDDTPRFELKDIDELINEFEMDNGRRPRSIDDLKRYFYIKYGEDFLAKIDQAITNKSKEIAMKTSNRVQAASGGLAGIINL